MQSDGGKCNFHRDYELSIWCEVLLISGHPMTIESNISISSHESCTSPNPIAYIIPQDRWAKAAAELQNLNCDKLPDNERRPEIHV